MEVMPCRDRQPALEPAAAAAGGGSRQLRFAEPGPGSADSPSPESSRSSCGDGGEGCCAGNGGLRPAPADWPLEAPAAEAAQLKLLPMNDQIRELQTIIRDKTASRGDFVFSADRLIRLVVEEGLNRLPYTECTVTTPTGYKYEGVKFEKGNCGVSIMRSGKSPANARCAFQYLWFIVYHLDVDVHIDGEGKILLLGNAGPEFALPLVDEQLCPFPSPNEGEAMEQGLRDCCRSIRIGKILIQSDEETQRAKVYYAKFPPDIYRRKVLLMYPILSTGNTVIAAVKVLIEHGVQPNVIILLSLFSTPHGAKSIIQEFPDITILTTEVHPVAPTHFGQKYFGTD